MFEGVSSQEFYMSVLYHTNRMIKVFSEYRNSFTGCIIIVDDAVSMLSIKVSKFHRNHLYKYVLKLFIDIYIDLYLFIDISIDISASLKLL